MNLLRHVSPAFPLVLSVVAVPVGASLPAGPAEMDPISSECMVCHDGSNGVPVRYCLPSQRKDDCRGHVISMDYAELAGRVKGLVPAESLPPEVALFNGILTCVTCHGDDPHLGQPLAMDNFGSRLCRTCHTK